MADITIESEGFDREIELSYSSDRPSVRRPYTRKPHIPEDDAVFGTASSIGGEINFVLSHEPAFYGDGIFNLHIPEIEPGKIPSDAFGHFDFSGVVHLKIFVPAELLDSIKADANWSDYVDVLFPEPETDNTEETPGEP